MLVRAERNRNQGWGRERGGEDTVSASLRRSHSRKGRRRRGKQPSDSPEESTALQGKARVTGRVGACTAGVCRAP